MDNFNLNFHVNDSLQPAEEKSLSLSLSLSPPKKSSHSNI